MDTECVFIAAHFKTYQSACWILLGKPKCRATVYETVVLYFYHFIHRTCMSVDPLLHTEGVLSTEIAILILCYNLFAAYTYLWLYQISEVMWHIARIFQTAQPCIFLTRSHECTASCAIFSRNWYFAWYQIWCSVSCKWFQAIPFVWYFEHAIE